MISHGSGVQTTLMDPWCPSMYVFTGGVVTAWFDCMLASADCNAESAMVTYPKYWNRSAQTFMMGVAHFLWKG